MSTEAMRAKYVEIALEGFMAGMQEYDVIDWGAIILAAAQIDAFCVSGVIPRSHGATVIDFADRQKFTPQAEYNLERVVTARGNVPATEPLPPSSDEMYRRQRAADYAAEQAADAPVAAQETTHRIGEMSETTRTEFGEPLPRASVKSQGLNDAHDRSAKFLNTFSPMR